MLHVRAAVFSETNSILKTQSRSSCASPLLLETKELCSCYWRRRNCAARRAHQRLIAIWLSAIVLVQFSFVMLAFCTLYRVSQSGLRRQFPLACAVVHPASFAVNGALVASRWQHRHRAWTVTLHPPINAEHEARQAASAIVQVFSVTRPGIEPNLPALRVQRWTIALTKNLTAHQGN